MGGKTVKSSLKQGEVTYEYVETKTSDKGGGPRGLDIWVEGERGRTGYDIEPNPHDNPKYNKSGGATKFYAALAEDLAKDHVKNGKFAKKLKVTWQGETYELES